MPTKDVKEMVQQLRRAGFRVELAGRSCHYKIYSESGVYLGPMASTPSDRRSLKNWIARFRRLGYEWPPPKKGQRE